MYYIFVSPDGTVTGYISEDDLGDQPIELPYVTATDLPPEVENTPEGYVCKYNKQSKEFYLVEVPKPDLTTDPITQLQIAIAELAEAQEQTITEIQLALAELAEIIAGGDE